MQQSTVKTIWTRQRRHLPVVAPPALQVSRNAKTGVSLNVLMHGSCRPTRHCYQTCYGLLGPISMANALHVYGANLARLNALADASSAEITREADRLADACRAAGQDFLRVHGVGDLVAGTIRLINRLSRRHPGLRLWVSTRKADLARQIVCRPNVHLMLSTDCSTQPADWTAFRQIVSTRRGQAFLAYVQSRADEVVPADVRIVFAQHVGSARARWAPEPRTCPATVHTQYGGAEHDGACSRCRRCFDAARRR